MWADGMKTKEVQAQAIEKTKKVASRVYSEKILDPKRFGGLRSNGKVVESNSSMFNSKGELNADSREDALTQLQHFAALREKYRASADRPYYTTEEKQQIVEAALHGTPEERLRFGAEMIPLILERLDYEGFIRQVFRTHNLAQGQINSYEKDVNVTALVTNEDGMTISHRVQGTRVLLPEFLITAMPTITVAEIAQRQFDIVERTHDKTTFQIMLKEDRQGIRELYAAAALENDIINVTSTVSKSVLETLQYEVERHRLQVDKFIMNRAELGDLKKNMNAIDFDPVTSRDLLLTGVFGSIWGVNVLVTAGVDENGLENVSVPEGVIFAVTEGRYLGVMPIRVELTVFPADQFVNQMPSYGWFFCEQVSQAVLNPRAVAMAKKSSVSIPAWMQ